MIGPMIITDLSYSGQCVAEKGYPVSDRNKGKIWTHGFGRELVMQEVCHQSLIGADQGRRSTNIKKMELLEAAGNDNVLRVEQLVKGGWDVNVTDDEGWTPLMKAARGGHLDVVRVLVDHRAGVNIHAKFGGTSLMWAAESGHLDIVRFLVQHGADADACNTYDSTSLLLAAEYGHADVVHFLVEHGAAVDARDAVGHTPLVKAAQKGHLVMVRNLVEHGAGVDGPTKRGETPLMWAARFGHIVVVQFLEEHGAVVDASDNDRLSPLVWAAQHGHLDVVRFLVDHGATVDAIDNKSRTPLVWASQHGHLDVVSFLVEHGAAVDASDSDRRTPLVWATRCDHWDVVHFLVECGATVDARDNGGETALIRAARGGHLEVVRILVDHGAGVDIHTNGGLTPLMWAAHNGHLHVVQHLVERGATVDAHANGDLTSLIWAAQYGHLEVVQYLVERGAFVDTRDKAGETPLTWASCGGHLEVVRFLVENGATVDTHNKTRETALLRAARGGHLGVVRILEENGAALDVQGSGGLTPLMWAARKGHLDVVCFLVEHGANSNLKSTAGDTALSFAIQVDHQEIVHLLLTYARYQDQRSPTDYLDMHVTQPSNTPSSWVIAPFEVEVEPYIDAGHFGGDFRGKWLDADVVVKLFVDDVTRVSFVAEVRLWHKLRHPNVLKLYGVCNTAYHFFVCEYASNGSLPEYLKPCDVEHQTPWKFLHEAALGLEYLHERKIVHDNLRGSNILIGSDGLAKLSGFGSNVRLPERTWSKLGSWLRWVAPESLKGEQVSPASNVYSLGMCIIEAISGAVPFDGCSEMQAGVAKMRDSGLDSVYVQPAVLSAVQRELVLTMCRNDPLERLQMSAVVSKLEEFAHMEATSSYHYTEFELLVGFDEFDRGKTSSLWTVVQNLVDKNENCLYRQMWHELELIYDNLKAESHPESILQRFHDLLSECQLGLDAMSQQTRVHRLSATRARDHSIQGLHRRIIQLLQLVRPEEHDGETRETEWKRLCSKQVEVFVSEASEACVLLSSVDSEEDRTALVAVLRAELRNSDRKYTDKQLEVLQKTYNDIVSKSLEDVQLATTPEWFIPWFELEMNEMATLGEGGFGSVIKAKWLDSEVVVKKLEIADKDAANDNKKREMRRMFEREVDIWFGLSHPHVVRLFGACHVGRPFFVCELAPNGTLVEYLRHHPDELWSKLREAALGVQYLHARGIVHGDLKGNNILIGSDGKAKVTDFGLSGVFEDDSTDVVVSGAWHWVAPECLLGLKPSFASDIYSLGMCIIEALRVINGSKYPLPWGELPNMLVKHHATRSTLPLQPKTCSDEEWTLIERMCKSLPTDRMQIMTVVDELEKLADRHGDLSRDTNQIESDIGNLQLSSSSMASSLAAMKALLANYDTRSDWEGGILQKIYQLLWDRLEQVATQLFPDDEETIVTKTTISDFSALVEHSIQRTQEALDITSVIPLVKFTELGLGGYALHRRLDKFMAAHAVAKDAIPLHDWTSACSTFMGVKYSRPTSANNDEDCTVNEATGAGKRTALSTEVAARS